MTPHRDDGFPDSLNPDEKGQEVATSQGRPP
jgi:hypothetical protein